jgi:ribosomal protein S18 acetylase RimI-like enzyme
MTEHDGPADLAGMQALAERVSPQTGYRSVGDLAWNYALSHDRPDDNPTALWRVGSGTDDTAVAAWAWLERPAELMLQVDPRYPELADEVLGWARERAGEPLTAAVADTETPVVAALRRHGYQPQDGPFFCCLTMHLSDAPAQPALPPGYRIRAVSGDADAARWVAVHKTAFTGSRFDVARRLHLTSVPPHRPELDLAVEAPDGSFAAYCLGWYDEQNKTGEFEPVGASPEHRRRGLAAAVSIAVLHGFLAAGAQRAIVNARGDADYPAPRRLYESLGFREHTRTTTYGQAMATDRAKRADPR